MDEVEREFRSYLFTLSGYLCSVGRNMPTDTYNSFKQRVINAQNMATLFQIEKEVQDFEPGLRPELRIINSCV